VLQELFTRYASGGETLRSLAQWLNTNPACPRSPSGASWSISKVAYILANPVYVGKIRYNVHRVGYYDSAPPGSEFVTEGRHEALITQEVFDQVQARLAAANRAPVRVRQNRPVSLGAGLFFCTACGGPMRVARREDATGKRAQYSCRHGHDGQTICAAPGYALNPAHSALLAQVTRLQGRPWDPSRLHAVIASGPAVDARADLQRALAATQEEMRRHIRNYNSWVDDPTPQEVQAHREVGREISGRITALEAQIATVPAPAVSMPSLRTLHEQLRKADLATVIDQLAAQGDEVGLRDLLLLLVNKATVLDRVPANKSKWLKVEVRWTQDVELLLKASLLTLAPDVQRPDYPATLQEQRQQVYRRYAARKKAGLIGVVPPARNGVVVP
jgi:hypothetical protein